MNFKQFPGPVQTTYRSTAATMLWSSATVLSFDGSDASRWVFAAGRAAEEALADLDEAPNRGDDGAGYSSAARLPGAGLVAGRLRASGLAQFHCRILSEPSMVDGRITDEISPLVEITGHRATDGAFPVVARPACTRSGQVPTAAGSLHRRRPGWIELLAAGKSADAVSEQDRRGGSSAVENPP